MRLEASPFTLRTPQIEVAQNCISTFSKAIPDSVRRPSPALNAERGRRSPAASASGKVPKFADRVISANVDRRVDRGLRPGRLIDHDHLADLLVSPEGPTGARDLLIVRREVVPENPKISDGFR
jgi:hypothetical protein